MNALGENYLKGSILKILKFCSFPMKGSVMFALPIQQAILSKLYSADNVSGVVNFSFTTLKFFELFDCIHVRRILTKIIVRMKESFYELKLAI